MSANVEFCSTKKLRDPPMPASQTNYLSARHPTNVVFAGAEELRLNAITVIVVVVAVAVLRSPLTRAAIIFSKSTVEKE